MQPSSYASNGLAGSKGSERPTAKVVFEDVSELCQIRIPKVIRNYKTLDLDDISGVDGFPS